MDRKTIFTYLLFVASASCFPVLAAEKYVVVEDVIVSEVSGSTITGMPASGTSRTVQRRTISCSQLRQELRQLNAAMENVPTGSREYAALYDQVQRYYRVLIYQCE